MLAVFVALSIAEPAAAQPLPEAAALPPPEAEEIVVEAPRTLPPPVTPPVEKSPYTGAPAMVASLRVPVFHDDLDLTRPDQAALLMERVESVARDLCKGLDALYPLSRDPDCYSRAVGPAKSKAAAAIDKAMAAANP